MESRVVMMKGGRQDDEWRLVTRMKARKEGIIYVSNRPRHSSSLSEGIEENKRQTVTNVYRDAGISLPRLTEVGFLLGAEQLEYIPVSKEAHHCPKAWLRASCVHTAKPCVPAGIPPHLLA